MVGGAWETICQLRMKILHDPKYLTLSESGILAICNGAYGQGHSRV